MAVFRVEKNRNYTVMSNVHLRDRSLPLKAKGLLSLILSLPDGWDFTLKGLAKLSADGLDSTRSAIRELEKSGYIIRRQLYDGQGRFAKNEYTVFESPQPVSPSSDIPLSGNPTTGNPATATPSAGSPMQLNTIGVNNQVSNTLLSNYPSINLDGMDAMEMRNEYEELIRENLEIDILSQDSRYDIARVNEMVEIMLDAICSQSPTIRIIGVAMVKLHGFQLRKLLYQRLVNYQPLISVPSRCLVFMLADSFLQKLRHHHPRGEESTR